MPTQLTTRPATPHTDGCTPQDTPARRTQHATPHRTQHTPDVIRDWVPAVVSAGLRVPVVGGPEGADADVEYANFDHGATAPALVAVQSAVEAATRTYSSVHRGAGWASRVTSAHYEAARAEVARFVGARHDDQVVFTKHTTESMNLLARALPQGTHVVVFDAEHHATLLPWAPGQVTRLPVPESPDAALDALDAALAAVADAPHRLVVVTGASNVTGELWPAERIVALARRHDARVALDAAQLVTHRAVDIAALGVDWVAFSGHKLYAPYGSGVLIGRADWLDAAPPALAGGGASAAVDAESVRWQTGPARHEAGSPHVLGAIALAAACATFSRHRAAIEAHEAKVQALIRDGVAGIPGLRTWSIFGADHARVPVLTFTIDGLEPALVSAALSHEHGIGVRDGKFCAHRLVDHLLRGEDATTAVRVSVGLANTEAHAHRLVAALRELATHGPRAAYATDDAGHLVPVGSAPIEVAPLW